MSSPKVTLQATKGTEPRIAEDLLAFANAVLSIDGFRPSASYNGKLTTTAAGVATTIPSGTARIHVQSLDTTATDFALLAFGTDEADAILNLAVAANQGETGVVIGSNTNIGNNSELIGVPADAGAFAIVTGVSGQTQILMVNMGA